ncbi:filamentous hemagglutinin N-terminal domain-containing protein, partial [Hyella patelloides]|uniref:two-partner secretion domain-containing protein n=1 Tax=Hyella patelloides TaxID=1982969 RepID=UPI0011A24E14
MNLFPASYFFKSTIVFSLLICSHAQGQVVPDETLPENSAVTSQDSTIQIDGGTQAGDNLFHSFERFSVPVDNTASFNNAVEIQNIFSRVTGSSISEIDGIVRANGTANLFLINPNGIIFGENASLNIGGSFLGSTADSIIFSDGFEFSATNSQTTPLLTISAPIGLGIKATSGDIINRSFATDIDGNFVGLQVPGEQTLAFVGGNVFIEGGILTAESGRIEIGSVGEDNTVNLSLTEQGFSLDYQEVREFKDINLSALAFVDTSGDKGGDISIQGRQLILTGDSAVVSTTFGTEAGGTVEINTSELVEMDGDATTISTSTEGTGKAGDIFIETNRLIVRDGAFVENVSLAEGSAGNLTVKATESVDLVGTTSDIEFPSGLFAEANDVGSGGNLTVETQNLTVRDGAAISISNFGIGQGGNLTIKATESFEVLGTALDDAFPTTVRADADSIGSGGTLIVETQRLTIKDGAKISTDTFFNGDAGNLIIKASESIELFGTSEDGLDASGLFALVNDSASGNGGTISIETKQLIVRDGAQISTLASNEGQGGTATINASDSILLSGTSSLDDAFSSSGVFVSASLGSSGDAGELTINTGELTVEKGAKISADNFGMRAGANVDLNVDRLIIRDGGIVGA